MRPIKIEPDPVAYASERETGREVFRDAADDDPTSEWPAKRRAVSETIGDRQARLEAAVATPGEQAGADAVLRALGAGWENATRWLVAQTGQYCAYCDAPVYSKLLAQPVLPARWFPTLAFDADKLLLECAACRSARADRPTRACGTAEQLLDPDAYAWPHRFWVDLMDPARLPFSHELRVLDGAPRRLTAAQRCAAVYRFREGLVTVDRTGPSPGAVRCEFQVGQPVRIASWIAARAKLPHTAGVKRIIDAFDLNGQRDRVGIDRRLELRTWAHLRALDLRWRLDEAARAGETELRAGMLKLLPTIARGTGFWGVWMSAFADDPQIRTMITKAMLGTAATGWEL